MLAQDINETFFNKLFMIILSFFYMNLVKLSKILKITINILSLTVKISFIL